MKLIKSKNANPNYLAKIVNITSFYPHPNAEKLKLCNVDGNSISVGIDSEPGYYLYFPLECQINPEFLKYNNLYRKSELNIDNTKSGFFEEKGRVKCVKLRGLLSQGIVLPIESLLNISDDCNNFNEIKQNGEIEFNYIDDKELCWKYVIKTKNKGVNLSGKSRNSKENLNIIEGQFKYHIDTEQLGKNINMINPNDLIQISLKEHGTSAIFCNLLVKKKLSILDKIAKLFKCNIIESEYKIFCSSRKVIKDPDLNKHIQQHYYDYDIWNLGLNVIKDRLQKGMTMYCEIVGYMPTGSMIQKDFDYGCIYDPNKYDYSKMTPQEMYNSKLFDIKVYRITTTNVDGKIHEWSSKQIQDFCNEQGLHPVLQLYYGYAKDLYNISDNWNDKFLQYLKDTYLEKDSIVCKNKVPEEGIVLRKETMNIEVYKLKALRFFEKESKMLDEGIIDIENEE